MAAETVSARNFKRLLIKANDEADPQKKDYITPLEMLIGALKFDDLTHEIQKCDLLQKYLHDSPDADEMVLVLRSKNHRRTEHERRTVLTMLLALLKTLRSIPGFNLGRKF